MSTKHQFSYDIVLIENIMFVVLYWSAYISYNQIRNNIIEYQLSRNCTQYSKMF